MGTNGARWRRRLGLLTLGVIAGMVLIFVLMKWPQRTLVQREAQSPSVSYQDGFTHHLGLYRERTLFSKSYHLMIGSDPSLSYGHGIDIGFTGSESFRIRTTEWTNAGVLVRFTTGHELFVPAAKFIGGR